MGAPATSAAHVLALLDEDDDSLKLHALQQLDRSVHDFWFQISASIAAIEALYEDEEFSHRELAALVASKVRPGGLAALGGVIWAWPRHHRPLMRPGPPRRCRRLAAVGGWRPRNRLARQPFPASRHSINRCSTTWATWTMR